MKKALLILVLHASCVALFAQNPEQKSQPAVTRNMGIEVSAGYSMPFGSYASSDRQNDKTGYAVNGWLMQVTFDWMGKKDFGLAFQYSYQKNAMKDAVNLVYPNGITDSAGSRPWSNNYLLAGPVFMKNIGRLHLDAKILGGVIVSSGSAFDTPNPQDTMTSSFNKNVATGFGYQVSGGVGFAFSAHVALKLNVGLLGGWPGKNRQYGSQLIGWVTYKDPVTGIEYQKPVYSAPVEYDIKKVVSTFNASLGLVFRF